MRHILTLTTLSVALLGGVAAANPHEEVRVHETVRGPVVHETVRVNERVNVRGPVVRENIHENVVVRGGPVVHENVVVRTPVAHEAYWHEPGYERNLIIHEPGREGVVVRGGPVWHEGVHFYDYGVRPEYRYESFAPLAGYNWHRGQWIWSGVEWVWTPGFYVRVTI